MSLILSRAKSALFVFMRKEIKNRLRLDHTSGYNTYSLMKFIYQLAEFDFLDKLALNFCIELELKLCIEFLGVNLFKKLWL